MTVVFNSAAEIRDFVGLANRQCYAVTLHGAGVVFNGKSILSLFCVRLGEPLRVETPPEVDPSEFYAAIAPYCQTNAGTF
jgi:hypothetical protein